MGYILRVLAAFGLLSLTYNPTQYNFARWAEANWSAQMPLAVLFGLLLLVGYIIYQRATLRSTGLFGMCLVLALVAALPAGIQLFTMFHAFPDLLNLLAEIMGEAPRLAAHLGRRPSLLESVLSSDFYAPLGDVDTLVTDCRESLTDCMFYEDNLDATRRWNADKRSQVGVQLLRGVVDCSTWYVDAHALLSCVFAALAQWVIVRTACCGVLLR